jgi:ABC-type multidrug transport system fused ATPase/permease subunit
LVRLNISTFETNLFSSRLKTEEQITNYETNNNSKVENYEQAIQERSKMIYLLPLVVVIVAVTTFLQGTIFFRLATNASINFHRSLATTVIDASMEFFHIHYVGNILNRFSEDLLFIDEIVPYSMYLFLNVRFYVFVVLNNFGLGICTGYWNHILSGDHQ